MNSGRLRRFLLALFLFATVTSALHTLEHHHSHEHCPICTVSEHLASPDVVVPFEALTLYVQHANVLPAERGPKLPSVHFIPSRAPPSVSLTA